MVLIPSPQPSAKYPSSSPPPELAVSGVEKINLLGLDRSKLEDLFSSWGAKPYHARQLLRWVCGRGCDRWATMSDLSEQLRRILSVQATITPPPILDTQLSRDGTRKWLFGTAGAAVETVLIPEARRRTLCVSSQVGCALACSFCHTGQQGFLNNLSAAEIVGQLWTANFRAGAPSKVTNVVFMGMGEPLLNLAAVAPAVRLMTDPLAYGLSRRRVTISTAGVVPGIDRLRELAPVALAVSLHAADNDLRDELVPLNRRYPLAELIDACRRYLSGAPRDFITFEYALLDKVNDAPSQARDLARLIAKIPAKINLIPFNPFPGSRYRTPSTTRILAFRDELNGAGLTTTIRRTRGRDIMAACGQLAGRVTGRQSTFMTRAT